tara:strand:+ start:764 stop:1576 length:813 start_codon:yes stop_codon:yes gene_type:complete
MKNYLIYILKFKLFKQKKFYSQIGEDIIIYNNFINKNEKNGTYVEIGGGDGYNLSNSKFFNKYLGFKGILIEPVPSFFEKLRKNRPNDILINKAIDYKIGKSSFIGDSHTAGINRYLSKPLKERYLSNNREYLVDTIPMSQIIETTDLDYIDYFSIDVEGAELVILETMDWNIPVYVISIELNEKINETEEKDRDKNQKCREILLKQGFIFVTKVDINEFWINQNYFRKDLLYDKNIKQFKTLDEAGKFLFLAEHVKKEVQDNLIIRENC